MTMFEVLKSRYAVWKRYSRTVSELESLSSRELSDLGISRVDIPRLAREAARSDAGVHEALTALLGPRASARETPPVRLAG